MGLLDSPLRDAVRTILSELGGSGTLIRTTRGTYSPLSGDTIGETTTSYSVKISPPESYDRSLVDWTAASGRFDAIQTEDMQTMVAAKGLAITPSPDTDTLTFGGVVFKIVSVTALYAGDEAVAYKLQVRR